MHSIEKKTIWDRFSYRYFLHLNFAGAQLSCRLLLPTAVVMVDPHQHFYMLMTNAMPPFLVTPHQKKRRHLTKGKIHCLEPHSVWYRRYKEYSLDTLDDYDFVLTDAELIEADPALNILSSEIGVKEYFTKKSAPEFKGGIPFFILCPTWAYLWYNRRYWEHLRRLPYENGWAQITPDEEESRKTVVVLGRWEKISSSVYIQFYLLLIIINNITPNTQCKKWLGCTCIDESG